MGALVRSGRRAEALPEAAATRGQQYLTFTVAGDMFALAIASIKEIIQYRAPTDVPMMPAFMRGVINLRGRVVPVVDLAARFGRGACAETRRSCIVILELEQEAVRYDIGVVVDAVSAVVEIGEEDIEPPPTFGARLRADFMRGMGKLGDRLVIVLDIDQVVSVGELARFGVADEAVADAPRAVAGGSVLEANATQEPQSHRRLDPPGR